MKNIFEELYQEHKAIRAAYEAAATDEASKEARADMADLMTGINTHGASFARVFRAYKESRDKGNDYIDFSDSIWDKDVKDLIDCLRENGIDHFTFSSGWSSAIKTAWLFQENGYQLEGLIQINGDESLLDENEYELTPAYLFAVRS